MATIKIAHVINHEIGLLVHGKNYFRYLRDQGFDLHVVCPPGDYVRGDMVTEDGILVKAITFPARYTPVQDSRTLVQLIDYFGREQFDIVHTHTVKPGLLGRIAARLTGTPVVIHTIHGFHNWDDMSRYEQWFFLQVERLAMHFCDQLLSQNHEDIRVALRDRICRTSEITYLGNGIDLSYFDRAHVDPVDTVALRRSLGVRPHEHLVGMIGRLVRLKGYYDYLAAAKNLVEQGWPVKFLAVGPTMPEKSDALSPDDLIAEYGLQDHLIYLGVRNDVRELLAAMDVVVLASYAEGIPRVLLEAAAMGKAAVGTNVRGTREVIVPGETGLLVPPRDPPALATAIAQLLNDPVAAERMGVAARQRVAEQFDERLYFWRTDHVYRQLLARKRPERALSELRPLPNSEALLRAGVYPAGNIHVR